MPSEVLPTCCSNRKLAVASVVGSVIAIVGLVMVVVGPVIIRDKVMQSIPIRESSLLWDSWTELDIPLYVQFYFYDVQNPKEIKDGILPARLKQVGPYTFRKYQKKTNITFDATKETVAYILRKWFVFEPSLTNGNLSDVITTANVPLMGFCKLSEDKKLSVGEKALLNQLIRIRKSTLFVNHTVGELLFDGYFEEFIDFIAKKEKKEFLPDGKFGYFYNMNGSKDTFVAKTGLNDVSQIGLINAWSRVELNISEIRNGSFDSLTFWNDTYCNTINGTDGMRFAPNLSKDRILRVFLEDICRSIYIRYDKPTTVRGIPVYRFLLPKESMALSQENACFSSNCDGDDLMNISTCRQGAPLILSLPRFSGMDPKYMELYPDLNTSELIQTYAEVEPTTGITVAGARKIQLNIYLRRYDHVRETHNLRRPLVFPLFWMNESATITPHHAEKFRALIVVLPQVLKYSSLGILGLGIVIVVFSVRYLILERCCELIQEKKKAKLNPYASIGRSHLIRQPDKVTTPCNGTEPMLKPEGPQATSGPL